MIAVIAKQAVYNLADAAIDQIEALGDIRTDATRAASPHGSRGCETDRSQDELKITGPVVFDLRSSIDDLMQNAPSAPTYVYLQ